MKNEMRKNVVENDGENVFIQVTSNSVDGAYCAIASKLLLPEGENKVKVISGNYYQVNSFIEGMIYSLRKMTTVSNEEMAPAAVIAGYPYLNIDTIFITDILLKSETLADMLKYNEEALSNVNSGVLPKIIYCYNNSSNFNALGTNTRYPGARRVSADHWISYLIDKYPNAEKNGEVLDVLGKAISVDEYMYTDIRESLKYDKQKDMVSKNMRTYMLFYGIDKFIDSMVHKISVLKTIDFSKTESYICYNFEKFLLREMEAKITKNDKLGYFDIRKNAANRIAIIYTDNTSFHLVSKALTESNIMFVEASADPVDIVVAIDANNKDLCIRYADNSKMTGIPIRNIKASLRDMLFKIDQEDSGEVMNLISTNVELPILSYLSR